MGGIISIIFSSLFNKLVEISDKEDKIVAALDDLKAGQQAIDKAVSDMSLAVAAAADEIKKLAATIAAGGVSAADAGAVAADLATQATNLEAAATALNSAVTAGG